MINYNYDRITGEYISQRAARPDPLNPGKYLNPPAHATTIQPPVVSSGYLPVFKNGAWSVIPDIRGEWYLPDHSKIVIRFISDKLPPDATREDPPLTVIEAVEIITNKLGDKKQEKQSELFLYNGHNFYVDESDIKNITDVMLMILVSGIPEENPIPTPAPISGSWLTADIDAKTGNNIAIKFTVAEFRKFCVAIYTRNATIWGDRINHIMAINKAKMEGAEAETILSYDIDQHWSTKTEVV